MENVFKLGNTTARIYRTEVFPIPICVVPNATLDDLSSGLDLVSDTSEVGDVGLCGLTLMTTRKGYNELMVTVMLEEGVSLGTIVHESVHAAGMLCKACYIGYGPQSDGNETHAYLTEWVFRKCLECLVEEGTDIGGMER